jgi:TRAP-type C4-dicarboxylate transport system permease small subunit
VISPSRVLGGLNRLLLATERSLVAVGILGITAISIANVVARNLFGGSLPFAEEVEQALALWVTFGGLALGVRRARHIRMAALYDQLRDGARKVAWIVTAAGTAALLLVMTTLAVRYVAEVQSLGGRTPALRIPLAWVYAIVPVGLALGALEYALTLVRNATSSGVHASFDLEEGSDGAGGAM